MYFKRSGERRKWLDLSEFVLRDRKRFLEGR